MTGSRSHTRGTDLNPCFCSAALLPLPAVLQCRFPSYAPGPAKSLFPSVSGFRVPLPGSRALFSGQPLRGLQSPLVTCKRPFLTIPIVIRSLNGPVPPRWPLVQADTENRLCSSGVMCLPSSCSPVSTTAAAPRSLPLAPCHGLCVTRS